MGGPSRSVGKGSRKDHKYARLHQNMKKRMPDPDQVVQHVISSWKPEADEELPGGGEFYCQVCARHFLNSDVLKEHVRSKPHKRAHKRALADLANPYTQKDADIYAGKTS